ncbi:MAG: RnfABCDGE type electron transport complex subunit D [Lawsonibacter sp.]|jgi:RnfABCDGE-type electron transport complex D subunit
MDSIRSLRLPPQVGQPSNTASMMSDVLVALVPTLAMAVFFFGPRVLLLTAISVGSCVLFEYGYRRLTGQSDTIRDLSACVTGMLLAMSLPANASYWVPVLGAAFAIILVKQFYGGLGKNFMNPALAGRMLLATFPILMTNWTQPMDWLPLWGVDAVTCATPLSYLHDGTLPPISVGQMLLGQRGGCLGEVSAFMVLLGGCYLILRRVISLRIPLSYLGTVGVLALLFPAEGVDPLLWAEAQLLSGGLLLGAFFFAPDPTTSPVTPRGQTMFGIGCGLLTVLLRYCSSYPEGVGWAILTMNCCVWLLDRAGMPRRFGVGHFAVIRQWAEEARQSLAEIQFVKPHFSVHLPLPAKGKAPGEEHLDQIRKYAMIGGHFGVVLLCTVLVIFGVHRYTDLDTARAEARFQQQILSQVMPQAAFSSETPYRAPGALSIQAGYSQDNELLGYCVEVQAQGFGGVITMEVGVNLNGQVTGVAVTDHKETAGVGTNAITSEALSRYIGKSGTIRLSGSNSVDAVTGATATSRAITDGVNRALAIVANLDSEGGDVSYVDGEV